MTALNEVLKTAVEKQYILITDGVNVKVETESHLWLLVLLGFCSLCLFLFAFYNNPYKRTQNKSKTRKIVMLVSSFVSFGVFLLIWVFGNIEDDDIRRIVAIEKRKKELIIIQKAFTEEAIKANNEFEEKTKHLSKEEKDRLRKILDNSYSKVESCLDKKEYFRKEELAQPIMVLIKKCSES